MRRAVLLALCGLAAAIGHASDEWRQWELASARLHAARIALLEREYRAFPDTRYRLAREQWSLRSALRNLAANRAPPLRTGLRLEAYICVNDDSAQPFLRYLPPAYPSAAAAPLLVFLHGYDPSIDLASDPYIPDILARLADETGACVVSPFGRSNTDFQGIGEQDVLRVIDEMATRYRIDRQRVVLVGVSMGGLGAWCLAARHPDRFNGVLVVSGRGDFYIWHRIAPTDLPAWQRRLVDTQFASAWLPAVTNLALVAVHGMRDDVVSFEQGRGIFDSLAPHDPHATFIPLPEEGHFFFEPALLHPAVVPWIRNVLAHAKPKDRPTGLRVGETGSHLQNAFLRPFVFIGGNTSDPSQAVHTLDARAEEWRQFAKGDPRTMLESAIETNLAIACHLFVFGEPETSPLVRQVLHDAGVRVASTSFRIAGRTLPRAGHGLWFTGRNPFNPQRLAIVQCGLAWGARLSDNHRYDRIPDVIVYGPEADRWGANLAVAAGFIDDQWRVQWFDPPVTPAIRRPAFPEGTNALEAVANGLPPLSAVPSPATAVP